MMNSNGMSTGLGLFYAYGPIEYKSFLNRSIRPIDGTLTGKSGSGSNGNDGVLYTSQISRTGASPLVVV